jgi:hypothetical protein
MSNKFRVTLKKELPFYDATSDTALPSTVPQPPGTFVMEIVPNQFVKVVDTANPAISGGDWLVKEGTKIGIAMSYLMNLATGGADASVVVEKIRSK